MSAPLTDRDIVPAIISEISTLPQGKLNKKAYEHIETWRTRPLSGDYPYVYVDGVYLKRSWGGEIQNVSVLVVIGVSQDAAGKSLALRKG